MKEFRTEINVKPSRAQIHLRSQVLTQGSCFSDAIGDRLSTYKVKTLVNPFGVIYNPESIHRVLEYSIFNEPLPDHTFLQHNEVFRNFNLHSVFAATSKTELADRLMNTIGSTHYFLKDAGWLMLTYGTAWAYHRKETGEIVANCHKLPSANFTKSLLTVDAITASFRRFYNHLKKLNDSLRLILTVSPVRHLKDTLELNSVSKSTLRVACHNISGQYDDVEYFPAYEMIMDDLRDYRFYKSDMLHPTTDAEDYIWEKFMERYFSRDLMEFVPKWKEILLAMHHRPFHPQSSAHQQFLADTLAKLQKMKLLVNVNEEEAILKKQIITKN